MFNLEKETELNINIPIEKILSNYEFHPKCYDAIKKKFKQIEITNEIINENNTDDKVYFIKFITLHLNLNFLYFHLPNLQMLNHFLKVN